MEVGGQLHAQAALPPRERTPGTHMRGSWVGLQSRSEGGGEEEKYQHYTRRELNSYSRTCSLVTILTELVKQM
jgi:hypothetical protein